MDPILLGAAINGAIAITFLVIARWASRRQASVRNVVSFSIAAVASYATGFTLDMVFSAVDGELPTANIVLPSITWSSIAIVSLIGAFSARGSRVARALPFWLNSAVALLAGFVHIRNAAIGSLLLFGGMFVWSGSVRSAAVDDINSQAVETAVKRLRVVTMWTMWARTVTLVGAAAFAVWLIFLTYSSSGVIAAFGWFVGLSVVYRFGASPMLAVAASVLSYRWHVVGSWLPITSYLLGALLLYVDTQIFDLKQRMNQVRSAM